MGTVPESGLQVATHRHPVHERANNSMRPNSDILIRDAYIMTMDDEHGDIEHGDIRLHGTRVDSIGTALPTENAEVLDGRGMIVLPGLVETHWHLWTSLLRSMSGDDSRHGYFPTSRELGSYFTPWDMHCSTGLALAEAIHSGITFVHDWCHNARSKEHVAAELQALANSGIRARFSYGTATGARAADPMDLEHLTDLASNWPIYSNSGLLSLGLAWRGLEDNKISPIAREEFTRAQELGLPISVHANNRRTPSGAIAALDRAGFLCSQLQVIHGIWSTEDEISALARHDVAVSISPFSELRIGFGIPPISRLLHSGIRLGLSIDTPALSGSADLFSVMKMTQNLANGLSTNEFHLPARRVLELATIDGARSVGLEHEIGSLIPHKRADLIMIQTHQVNLGVFTDPAHMIVEGAQPANVDTVIIDGQFVKRAGNLVQTNVDEVLDQAYAANRAVRERAGWW